MLIVKHSIVLYCRKVRAKEPALQQMTMLMIRCVTQMHYCNWSSLKIVGSSLKCGITWSAYSPVQVPSISLIKFEPYELPPFSLTNSVFYVCEKLLSMV